MNRSEILDKAKEIVCNDRQKTYKEPEDNFKTIADFWSAYLGHEVSSADVAAMMILLKLARVKSNPKHLDNWLDICGYGGCGGEIATKETPVIEHIGSNSIVLLRNEEIKPGGSENED